MIFERAKIGQNEIDNLLFHTTGGIPRGGRLLGYSRSLCRGGLILHRGDEIESMQQYMQSDQYIEDIAKSKLGLAYDNEIIFKEKDK